MYKERMNNYYPQVVKAIAEFQAIIDSEYPEFENLAEGRSIVIDDAYLTTMSVQRIEQWENLLGIKPMANSSVSDRRETIIARIRGQGKLNTELINSIVNAFTGGTAVSWVANGVLYVEITPPPGDKQFKFENLEQELRLKIPAHMGLEVSRNYLEWNEIKGRFTTWQEIKDNFDTWQDVYLFFPFN